MKIVQKINDVFRIICTLMLALMTLLVILQVFSRAFFKFPVAQIEELSRYCLVWSSLLGGSVGIFTGAHVAVGLFRDRLPAPLKKAAVLFAYVVVGAFFVIFLYYGWKLSMQAMIQTSSSMPFLKMGFVMMAVPLSGLLGIVNLVAMIYAELAGGGNGSADSAE